MKSSRLSPLLGIAAVLYLAADAAAQGSANAVEAGALALAAIASLTPFIIRGSIATGLAGARRVGLMGTVAGVSLAAQLSTPSLLRDAALPVLLPILGHLVLDVALTVPDQLKKLTLLRRTLLAVTTMLSLWGLLAALPAAHFDDTVFIMPAVSVRTAGVVLAAYLALAFAYRLLRRFLGSSPEALASNAWALAGIAPSFLATLVILWAPSGLTGLESLIAAAAGGAVLLGHVALIDTALRLRAGKAVREYLALSGTATVCFFVAKNTELPESDNLRATVIAFGLLLFIGVLVVARFVVHKLFAPYGGRLLDTLAETTAKIIEVVHLEQLGEVFLVPLRSAMGGDLSPVLFTIDPHQRVDLDIAGLPRVQFFPPPAEVESFFAREKNESLIVASSIFLQEVRRPDLRDLCTYLRANDIFCVVPLRTDNECEGYLTIPRGQRRSTPSLEEVQALAATGLRLGAVLAHIASRSRLSNQVGALIKTGLRDQEIVDGLTGSSALLRRQISVLGSSRRLHEEQATAVAYSASMKALLLSVSEAATIDAPVQLIGESGTCAEQVARLLHEQSARKLGPYLVFDCAACAPEQTMTRLFGDKDTPGWLELATSGTLLLLDVVALSSEAQRALARALSERRRRPTHSQQSIVLDVRLVAASRSPLRTLVPAKSCEPDLAEWFSSIELRIPPLRERRADIPSLCLLAVDKATRAQGRPLVGISPEASALLESYDWPGNLRELQEAIDFAVAACSGPQLLVEHLRFTQQAT